MYYNTGIVPQTRVLDLLLTVVSSLIHGGFSLGKRRLKKYITAVLVGLHSATNVCLVDFKTKGALEHL